MRNLFVVLIVVAFGIPLMNTESDLPTGDEVEVEVGKNVKVEETTNTGRRHVSDLKTSDAALNLIKKFEGFRSKAYRDVVGVPTIGYGTTRINGVRVKIGQTISEKQAHEYLMADVRKFESELNILITVPLSQNEYDALITFVYNLGATKLRRSTLLRLLNAEKYSAAGKQFTRWTKADGKVLLGLIKRRKAEQQLFTLNS